MSPLELINGTYVDTAQKRGDELMCKVSATIPRRPVSIVLADVGYEIDHVACP